MSAPDSPALADGASQMAAAYIHIPFCAHRCPYCDFAVVEGVGGATRYFTALESEIDAAREWRNLDAVFFGGGTPSLTGATPLRAVLNALRRRFGLADDCEVSLEANPEDWTPQLGTELVEAGFTRVSFGVQSWDPSVLRNLGRRHLPGDADSAVAAARDAGFASVSVDLIYGEPAETADSWVKTLHAAVETGAHHVSTYALTVEPGTALHRAVRAGAPAPDDDVQAERYEAASQVLARAGFTRYEVSNHALQGHACRYNLIVWARGEYLGFGLGAHAFVGGKRTRNARVMREYLARVEAGGSGVVGVEELDPDAAELERLFVGIRRVAGVPLGTAGQTFLDSQEGRRLQRAGVIAAIDGRLRVVRPLLTDTVARALLG